MRLGRCTSNQEGSRRKNARDPLHGLTYPQRDALEQATTSMLVFWTDGTLRALRRPFKAICAARDARELIGREMLEPIGDGEAVRLTRAGERAARLSVARRANFRRFLVKEGRISP